MAMSCHLGEVVFVSWVVRYLLREIFQCSHRTGATLRSKRVWFTHAKAEHAATASSSNMYPAECREAGV